MRKPWRYTAESLLLRSLLFVPGNRADMIEKARKIPADALIFDLEDSVPPQEKSKAREIVASVLPQFAGESRLVFVRINPFMSGLTDEDLAAIIYPGLTGISIPKVEESVDIDGVNVRLDWIEEVKNIESKSLAILPWIESPRSLRNSYAIATANRRVMGLAFGADDYTLSMGIQRSRGNQELEYPRQVIAVNARAAGVLPLDTPYVDYKDGEGLITDCKQARQAGFAGKFAIHPSQVEIINRCFSPSPEEIEKAHRIIDAFEKAVSSGSAVTSLDGVMIDTPVADRARKMLELAKRAGMLK